MGADAIRGLEWLEVRVNERTRWLFTSVVTSQGRRGWGEATLGGGEAAVERAIEALRRHLLGLDSERIGAVTTRMAEVVGERTLATTAASSAIEQALWDIAGRRLGLPVHAVLGGAAVDAIAAYANINRRTRDRTPAGFATSASEALAAGYALIKIAPFDGLGSGDRDADREAYAAGLERIEAVRQLVGPGQLLVDCHWRLRELNMALDLVGRAGDRALYWIECPFPETPAWRGALGRLRAAAQERGVLLAGGEKATSLAEFLDLSRAGVYDVLMPDVKYCGGLRALQHIASAAAADGIQISPHNPSGPMAHAATVHVALTLPGTTLIETQFDESPLFASVIDGSLPRIESGMIATPRAAGFGVAPVARHPARVVRG